MATMILEMGNNGKKSKYNLEYVCSGAIQQVSCK